jgi:hypothetical protein
MRSCFARLILSLLIFRAKMLCASVGTRNRRLAYQTAYISMEKVARRRIELAKAVKEASWSSVYLP